MHRILMALPLLALACDDGAGDESPPGDTAIAHCVYVNAFSDADECKEYVGEEWTLDSAAEDCTSPLAAVGPGTLVEGEGCDRSSILGECVIDQGDGLASTLVFPGGYGDSCDGLELGCSFAQGTFVPS